jgi:hypothetical protein
VKKYIVDIDGTICSQTTTGNYAYAEPFVSRIKHFNDLYDSGHPIHYWTARGGTSGKDWSEFTRLQLEKWGVKYTSLSFKKPVYDVWIDDKAHNVVDYFNEINNRV